MGVHRWIHRFPPSLLILVTIAAWHAGCKKRDSPTEPTPPRVYDSPLALTLDSLRRAYDLPALAGAIITGDGTIDTQAVGCRRYGGAENVTNADLFHLGSNTKAFTAVLLAMLVDQGLLDWSTTLATVFPEYADIMRPEYKPVTLSDVLSHGAGFMANPSVQFSGSTLREQRTAAVAWTLQQPPAQQRGRYLYSNLGYIIAGAIAERLASQSFEELLMDRVLKPLGITRAGFGPMGTPGKEDQPLQHVLDNDGHHISISPDPSADNPPFYNSAGRLHMSIGDWAKFARWVLNNELGNVTLLKPETAARLTTGITQVGGTVYYA